MLSSSDFKHLEAAAACLEGGDYCSCFNELKRINNHDDARVEALRWRLYHDSGLQAAAVDVAIGMRRRYPEELARNLWRSVGFEKLGC